MNKFSMIYFLFFLFVFDVSSQELSSASFFEDTKIVDNKIEYTFDIPPNNKLDIKLSLLDQTEISNLKFTFSDGSVVTQDNADDYGVEITEFSPSTGLEMLISPFRAYIVSLSTPPSGSVTVSADVIIGNNDGVVPINLQFYSQSLFFRSELPLNIVDYTNQPITFYQHVVEEGSAPENSANVTLTVFQKGEALGSTVLKDDGVGNDVSENDGIYSGSYSFPSESGYSLHFETVLTDKSGYTVHNFDEGTIRVIDAPSFSLDGSFSVEMIDSNSNSLIDELKLTIGMSGDIIDESKYVLIAFIGDEDNVYNSDSLVFDKTTTELVLTFKGREINAEHASGPLKIKDVIIEEFDSNKVVYAEEHFGYTESYNGSQFERPNEIINQPQASSSLVDENEDNIYEKISISFETNVFVDGKYETSGLLRGANGKELKFSKTETLVSGDSTIDVPVFWNELLEAGLSGPAQIVYLNFYQIEDLSWSVVRKKYFGETPEFECWDFGDCSVHVPNTPPVANADSVYAIQNFSPVNISLLGNDSDADGDTLNLSFNQPANGSVGYLETNGELVYIPNDTYSGTDNFEYTITDTHPTNNLPKGGTDTAIVNVRVRSNSLPSIYGDSADVPFETRVAVDVLANDSDTDGDTLEIISVDQPTHGQVELIDNIIYYTPNDGYTGADSFIHYIKEKDEASGLFGNTTYNVTVSLNVVPPNASPIAQPDAYTLMFNEQLNMDVLINDTDSDGDSLTITAVSSPLYGTAQISGGSSISYTAPEQVSADNFTYEVSDGKGGTSHAIVSVNVIQPNYPPIAVDDVSLIQINESKLIDVLANDSDPNNDPLTITSLEFTSSSNGRSAVIENNQIRFTTDDTGDDSQEIFYVVSDSDGLTAQGSLLISINFPPVANTDNFTVLDGKSSLLDVRLNDLDINGDELSILSTTATSNASVEIVDEKINYTPTEGFIGSDSFTYEVGDGNGGTSTGTVSIFVNKPPIVVNDNASTELNRNVLINVLANDFDENLSDQINVESTL